MLRSGVLTATLLLLPSGLLAAKVEPGPRATPHLSVALRDLPVDQTPPEYLESTKAKDRINPRAAEPDQGRRGTADRTRPSIDPLAAHGYLPDLPAPAPVLSFEGTSNPTGCSGCTPPDPVGDVGPHHYVQLVNSTKITVYDKVGTLLHGPVDLSTLWSSGSCSVNDAGDPVVLYDALADRWVLAQFQNPHNLCFAVSQTEDPTGAYYVSSFATSQFPDYFKVGIWSDGYYVSTNESTYNAWVFERSKMLAGLDAGSQKATASAENFLLPADVDGLRPPPAGSPGLYFTFLADDYHGGASDRLELWAFHVDWATPKSSTFDLLTSPSVAAFDFTVCGDFILSCAPQASSTQKLDVVSEWPMFRFAYRNFDAHESLVGTFTVRVGTDRAALRWFELRRSGGGWSLFQEGTYDPTDVLFRFMGSVAQDHLGGMALGYTASGAALDPAIRYAARLAGDAAGALGPEVTLQASGGAQTGSNRWGDYAAMAIDPADDCTFWFTSEYYPATSSSAWHTRIGAFRLPGCDLLFLDDFETGGATRWSSVAP